MQIEQRTEQYIVKIPTFEGPLDLLLHLVRKNKLDIFDLPMSIITEQYLQFLEMMRALNIEIAGEYLLMAATLIYIKSQMLLPRPEVPEEEVEDPRLQIVEPLLELAKYQEVAAWLGERPLLGREIFVPCPQVDTPPPTPRASIFDLLAVLKDLLGRKPPRTYEVARARLLLSEKISEIEALLDETSKIFFSNLLQKVQSREEAIAYFLALLELAFRERIRLLQNRCWDDVEIVKR